MGLKFSPRVTVRGSCQVRTGVGLTIYDGEWGTEDFAAFSFSNVLLFVGCWLTKLNGGFCLVLFRICPCRHWF